MIVVKLKGGLGNQMFQYAFGRSLALRRGVVLRLDINQFENAVPGETPRTFKLDRFNIQAEIVSGVKDKKEIVWRLINKLGQLMCKDFHLRFHPIFLKIKFDYFIGFFQSFKYFMDSADELRRDFKLKEPLSTEAAAVLKQIRTGQSVSIHIRRGDYVSNQINYKGFGVCSLDYYQGAISMIKEKMAEPHFFIFSDDIEWTKKNLKIDGPAVYISSYNFEETVELKLMSQCKHNIIANSSFSWWGAWLNENPQKIVIAPQKWTNISKFDTIDLIPIEWIKL